MKLSFELFSSPGDREKAVIPALIYVGAEDDGIKGFSLSLGWWHWGVRFCCFWVTQARRIANLLNQPETLARLADEIEAQNDFLEGLKRK